jgi:glutathione S-transferase
MNNQNPIQQSSAESTTLYASRICPYSQRALLAALESNIKFEYVDIEFMAKPQWFVSLTPFGKVPVLVDSGHTIMESLAIVEYLNEEKKLSWLGETNNSRAFSRAWMTYCDKLHDITRHYFTSKEDAKLEENIFVLQDSLKKCSQYLSKDNFFMPNTRRKNLSALGIVYSPLFVLLNVLEEKSGQVIFSNNDILRDIAGHLFDHPSVGMLNNDYYKKELAGFIGRINPNIFRQEAVL